MDEITLKSLKKEARVSAAVRRDAAHAGAHEEAPTRLASLGLPPGTSGQVVSGFLPYRTEIDVRPLLAKLRGAGWQTALPVVIAKGEPLEFRLWDESTAMSAGAFGILAPDATAPVVDPDVLLVPMLAFDRAGYRLGYGGGFYDRSLARLRAHKPITAIGVAYAGQEVESVPHAAYDARLDWIMTEKGHFKCA